MKIKVKKESFLNSLNIVSKALKKGINYPIYECILIDATNDKIVLICTDGKITIKNIAEGEIVEKGKSAIKGNTLLNSIKGMPDYSEIEINVDEQRNCFINCGLNIKQDFPSNDETLYPNLISINKEKNVKVNEYKLKRIIDKTIISYEKNQNTENKMLKGIYIKVEKNKIIAKASDGYTLAIINEILNDEYKLYESLIPGTSLEEVDKLIKGEIDKDVNIYFNEKNIAFEIGETLFISNTLDAQFLDTDRIINGEYSTKIIVNRSNLIESLNRPRTYINEIEKKPVIFNIMDEEMDINLNSMLGNSYEKIEVKKTGKDLRIAFNPYSFINILNAIEDENITLYFSGSKQPVIIKDKQETYLYLLTATNIQEK